MTEREPLEPAALQALLDDINSKPGLLLALSYYIREARGGTFPERIYSKPYAVAYLLIALMMQRAGHNMDSVTAEIDALLNQRKTLKEMCATCEDRRYNEIGGNDFAEVALAANLQRAGHLSGAHWNAHYGTTHTFGPLVTLRNQSQYFPKPVDVITACKVFEIHSGIETAGDHETGCIELLACIANSLQDGGFLLVENEMSGIQNTLLEQMGFHVILRDQPVSGMDSCAGVASVLQFSHAHVSPQMQNTGISLPNKGGILRWNTTEQKYVLVCS